MFEYIEEKLCCDGLRIDEIANKIKTPFYLYSQENIIKNFTSYKDAFSKLSPLIAYAAKANSNIAILKLLSRMGAGCDVCSQGELFLAKKGGISSKKIVFNGNGKTEEDIRMAIKEGVFLIIADTISELFFIEAIAKQKINVGIRINPEIDVKTHPYIATGLSKSKFGIDAFSLLSAIKDIKKTKLNLVCLLSHIGSSITDLNVLVENTKRIISLASEIKGIKYIDIGGGLGISYNEEPVPSIFDFADKIVPLFENSPFKLIIEPGRSIVGNAGCLVTKVLFVKETKLKKFIVVDTGINDLIRPALYNSFHRILPQQLSKDYIVADIVGPLCEEGDFLGRERKINHVSPGSLLCIMDVGAYGFSMSSNYNGRLRCPEVMVIDKEAYIIRERETFSSILKNQTIPPSL